MAEEVSAATTGAKCDECFRSFPSRNALFRHLKVCDGSREPDLTKIAVDALASSPVTPAFANANSDFDPALASAKQLSLVQMSFSTENFLGSSLPIVDLREKSELSSTEAHVVIHLPFSKIWELCPQLPPRNCPFALLLDYKQREAALDYFMTTKSQFNNSVRIQFPIKFFIISTPAVLAALQAQVPLPPSRFVPRLWVPDPVMAHVEPLMASHARVVDLGCGSCRNLTFLAERAPPCCTEFFGVDNHPGAPARTAPMFQYHGVSPALLDLDLRKEGNRHELARAAEGTPTIFIVVRYLNRALLAFLASRLPRHSTLVVSHFCRAVNRPAASGALGASDGGDPTWPFDHPRPSQVLDRSELGGLFSKPRWAVSRDVIVLDSDHGRTMHQFIAQVVES